MKKLRIERLMCFVTIVTCMVFKTNAQGMLFDSTKYENVKTFDPNQLHGYATGNMPKAISLRKYAPLPIDQTGNSCVGVATTYEALSILHNQSLGLTNTYLNTIRAFDPYSVYNRIRLAPGCSEGSYTEDAFEMLEENGAKKMWMSPFLDCESDITDVTKVQAEAFTIADYRKLFDWEDKVDYNVIQKVIATGTPVVVAVYAPQSIWRKSLGGSVGEDGLWTLSAGDEDFKSSGHAICVIGYDDEKFGGSFEIMNSWGVDYGDHGFLWIKYKDFEKVCYGAYFMTINDYNKKSGCITGDCENGYTIIKFDNGDMYEGYLVNSLYSGFGIYTWADSTAYVGEWLNGNRNGNAIEIMGKETYRISKWTNDDIVDTHSLSSGTGETNEEALFSKNVAILDAYHFKMIRVRPNLSTSKGTEKISGK